jgi:hypothetical protein
VAGQVSPKDIPGLIATHAHQDAGLECHRRTGS